MTVEFVTKNFYGYRKPVAEVSKFALVSYTHLDVYKRQGLGSGFCDNDEELRVLAEKAFAFSPQLLIEKSLRGWKEMCIRDRCL